MLSANIFMVFASLIAAVTGSINADKVNVRKAPSTTSVVVGKLNSGDKVEVLGRRDKWLEIKAPQLYITADAVVDGKIKFSRVNLRSAPGTDSSIVGKGVAGMSVKVLETVADGKWLRIEPPDGAVAYVAASLVDLPPGSNIKDASPGKNDKPSDTPDKPDKKETGKKSDDKTATDGEVFGDIAVTAGSAKQVTCEGMLFPLDPNGTNVKFALAVENKDNTRYVVQYYVHTGGSKRYDLFSGKRVKLVGTSYSVPKWDKPLLKVKKIIPQK